MLIGFELYPRWVPLTMVMPCQHSAGRSALFVLLFSKLFSMGLNSFPGPVLLPSPDRHSYKILEPEISRNHDRLGAGG